MNFLFQFAELGGFEEIKKQIETAEKVDAPVRALLIILIAYTCTVNKTGIQRFFNQEF